MQVKVLPFPVFLTRPGTRLRLAGLLQVWHSGRASAFQAELGEFESHYLLLRNAWVSTIPIKTLTHTFVLNHFDAG